VGREVGAQFSTWARWDRRGATHTSSTVYCDIDWHGVNIWWIVLDCTLAKHPWQLYALLQTRRSRETKRKKHGPRTVNRVSESRILCIALFASIYLKVIKFLWYALIRKQSQAEVERELTTIASSQPLAQSLVMAVDLIVKKQQTPMTLTATIPALPGLSHCPGRSTFSDPIERKYARSVAPFINAMQTDARVASTMACDKSYRLQPERTPCKQKMTQLA